MQSTAKWISWLAMALLPLVFVLSGARWTLLIWIGLCAIPITLALAAFKWKTRWLRWLAVAINLLTAIVSTFAFGYMFSKMPPPPDLMATLPVVALGVVICIAPWMNSAALFRRVA
jgi:4-amino-4-deoxy-L-arabinose transferase-like glycosyltransferase